MDRTEELSEFLRSRRARITPEEAGVGAGPGVRRVPGLRREEVARLAGINVDYYVRLERGRNLNASEAVLDAVARALRLDATERAHLFTLARPKPFRGSGRPRPLPPQRVRPAMYRVLEALEPKPAMITGRRMDVLAANRTARAMYTDFDALPHRERNFARFVFLDENARSLFTDWRRNAADVVAVLHLYSGRHACDPQLAELIGELSLRSPEFRTWWADHNVHQHTHGTKQFHHPVVGRMTLSYETLAVMGDQDQTLTVYTAEPASASEAALDLLASWTGGTAPHPAPAYERPGGA
ncbi:helix-turn-helix transcriptional regulator [Streptomyces sp. SL13]|uniref:Helix-turn-helix transcriptional regulator n=1 Tax=Streptantibioticus silvisoli TaxID=2705255 RepID=A0AA90H4S2_9ACTN|nr:helix-turn-helix transcriptional regulator [Streptantibioticus silvisoli]MDI5961556.1 helix-turn-helix transcriptional regulator [Streptantibioticus silvisoli]MDI5968137.1 helix-turn-helix transcriptional regulator [Streptantibioticus silvisoli]